MWFDCDIYHNKTQHNVLLNVLSVILLNVVTLCADILNVLAPFKEQRIDGHTCSEMSVYKQF